MARSVIARLWTLLFGKKPKAPLPPKATVPPLGDAPDEAPAPPEPVVPAGEGASTVARVIALALVIGAVALVVRASRDD